MIIDIQIQTKNDKMVIAQLEKIALDFFIVLDKNIARLEVLDIEYLNDDEALVRFWFETEKTNVIKKEYCIAAKHTISELDDFISLSGEVVVGINKFATQENIAAQKGFSVSFMREPYIAIRLIDNRKSVNVPLFISFEKVSNADLMNLFQEIIIAIQNLDFNTSTTFVQNTDIMFSLKKKENDGYLIVCESKYQNIPYSLIMHNSSENNFDSRKQSIILTMKDEFQAIINAIQ